MAPSEDAMKLVYDSFKQHGINLHIDVGPDSIDFVTGKKWGKLSGGNEIPYKKKFNIKSSWNSTVNANFSKARHNVFKHCLFVDQYNGIRSGIANNIPGQFLLLQIKIGYLMAEIFLSVALLCMNLVILWGYVMADVIMNTISQII